MSNTVDLYDSTFSRFSDAVLARVRLEAFGEDIGQNSWLTADEYRDYCAWLQIGAESLVLEVGCGAGGPALFMAQTTGARVIGVDVNAHGVATGAAMAQERGLAERVQFQQVDAEGPLPFSEAQFDGLICIDAINHLSDRLGALREWSRVLKPGGRMLFTDPCTVTGLLSSEEIAIRSSIGHYIFAAPGEDARMIAEAGLELERSEDATENMATISQRRFMARQHAEEDLIALETAVTYHGQQRFLAMTHQLARERRLSRFVFLARKPE